MSYVFLWNWTKYVIYNDVIFIASCTNHAIGHEIQWPSREKLFFWLAINLNCKVVLRLLMGHLSKFGNHGIMNPIKASLMGRKQCTPWTIQPLSITKACSSILTLDIMGLLMMLIFCDIPRLTRIGSNVLPTKIPVLNTYWVTLDTWENECL